MVSEIGKIITDTGAYSCLDCGKCTVACPISRYEPDYSPRKFVYSTLRGKDGGVLNNSQLWSCLTCAMCEERCQSDVRYSELIRSLRAEAYQMGNAGQCTHGGALQSLMHIMTSDHLEQNRLGWLSGNLKTSADSGVLYFAGCLPYFDILFADIGVKTIGTAKGAVKLLNRLGIEPVVLPNERCCGHDLLWAGDIEGFSRLAEHNLAEIAKSGAKQVVTTCPECYHTLKVDYPRYLRTPDFEVIHLTQLTAAAVTEGKLDFRHRLKRVTYHDPCRLGRFSGIYDEPRTIINAISDNNLSEMQHSRSTALCCGTQAWMNCGATNKQIQAERLREANATGAEVLLTSCPKCQIHLKCAMHDGRLGEELSLEIEDITTYAARALRGQEGRYGQ